MPSRVEFEKLLVDGLRAYRHVSLVPRGFDEVEYLDLIWRLTEGRARFVVPRWWRDRALHAAGAPYALVDWEFDVGAEEDQRLRSGPARPCGSTHARARGSARPRRAPASSRSRTSRRTAMRLRG